MRGCATSLAILLALGALPAPARGEGRLAVLELRNKLRGGELHDTDIAYLSNSVRSAALRAVPGIEVITRENLVALLGASGRKLEDCEGECEVETGRRVGADYIVTGDVLRFGTKFKIDLRMHETRTARLLSGDQVSGATADELDGALHDGLQRLFAPLQNLRAAPAASGEERRSAGIRAAEADEAAARAAIRERQQAASVDVRRVPEPHGGPQGMFAVRAGLGGQNGILGVGVQARFGNVAVGVGSGTYAVSGGISLVEGEGRSGFYLDLHAALSRKGPLPIGTRVLSEGTGFGATAGYDWRPLPWLTLKAGAGGAYNSATWSKGTRVLVFDACAGTVF